MKILFATSNPHKVRELAQIWQPFGLEIFGLDELGRDIAEPVEDGATFEANARLKAVEYARLSGQRCLAEDSGLEVDALGGAPGVFSARYAGTEGTRAERDAANNAKLLLALRGVPTADRSARFVCALCLAEPDGRVVAETRGTYEGRIAEQAAGQGGFGYDPLLFLPDVGKTSAELSAAEKAARSHRGAAAREMARQLEHLAYLRA